MPLDTYPEVGASPAGASGTAALATAQAVAQRACPGQHWLAPQVEMCARDRRLRPGSLRQLAAISAVAAQAGPAATRSVQSLHHLPLVDLPFFFS